MEVQFEDEIDHAKRVVKLLKEKEGVDFILCLSHSGTWADKSASEDEILAKKVPEINAIISGHTHTKLSQPIMVGNTIIASAGNNGINLGLIFNKVVKTSLVKQDGTIEEINDTKLYRMVVGLYSAQMLSVVGDKSFGLMSVVPKAEDGTPIADFEKYILYDPEGNKRVMRIYLLC